MDQSDTPLFEHSAKLGASSVWSNPMLDVVMLVIAFAFFAASVAYVYACDQL
jgi:hypothetical protein